MRQSTESQKDLNIRVKQLQSCVNGSEQLVSQAIRKEIEMGRFANTSDLELYSHASRLNRILLELSQRLTEPDAGSKTPNAYNPDIAKVTAASSSLGAIASVSANDINVADNNVSTFLESHKVARALVQPSHFREGIDRSSVRGDSAISCTARGIIATINAPLPGQVAASIVAPSCNSNSDSITST